MITRRNMDSSLWRWPLDPLAGVDESARVLDPMRTLFGELDRGLGLPSFDRVRAMTPRVDLFDAGTELRLYAELPGFTENDIEVTVERNVVTLRGRRTTTIPDGHTAHRRERGDIQIARTLSLPCRVDPDRVEATLSNGVLQITMPKAPEERPRTIAVRTA